MPGDEPGPGRGEPVEGDGYAVAHLDDLGEGYGFRKVRKALGVTAFGVNAIVIPPGYETGRHFHDEQEELYFVHRGEIEIEFGDGTEHQLGPAASPASTPRPCARSATPATRGRRLRRRRRQGRLRRPRRPAARGRDAPPATAPSRRAELAAQALAS